MLGYFSAVEEVVQTMVDTIKAPGKNANCEEDVDEFLLSLETIETANNEAHADVFVSPPSPYDAMISELPENARNFILSVCSFHSVPEIRVLSFQEDNVIAYISVYIARKLRHRVCDACSVKLVCSDEAEQPESLEYTKQLKYDGAKDGLVLASDMLIDVVTQAENVYRDVIDDTMYCDHVKVSLAAKILDKVSSELSCETCKLQKSIIHLFVNVHFHHTLKETNRGLRQEGGSQNHKVKKFSHMNIVSHDVCLVF